MFYISTIKVSAQTIFFLLCKTLFYSNLRTVTQITHYNNYFVSGIVEIENLDDFINVKCIYLQNNMVKKIENLDKLKQLTMLFLNDNSIERIENLEYLEKLNKIDLSHNSIKTVENLSKYPNFQNI
jgi:Leucine-rich repeat (LRR) protein